MGLVFDKKTADLYQAWYRSPEGRAIDRALEFLLKELLDLQPGDRVLDIGCGSGNHLLIMGRLGLDIAGTDASTHMLLRAKERLGPGCTLKPGDAEDLPFDDDEFDIALLINTLEFVDRPLLALREAGRVARKRVFVGILNSLSVYGVRKKIHGYLGDQLFAHARLFSLWELKSLLRAAFGDGPVQWASVQWNRPQWPYSRTTRKTGAPVAQIPFSPFLGICATMRYTVKTDNLTLEYGLKSGRHSLIGAKSFEHHSRRQEVEGHEGSLSL